MKRFIADYRGIVGLLPATARRLDRTEGGGDRASGCHLIDPATGNGLSIAALEGEAAVPAARTAIEERPETLGRDTLAHWAEELPAFD
ncbi:MULTISPECIES: hypothetical protein [Streptomyces]|uniref:hypothetical protein n=1 Tax=Streptomyces TaxID=1883 RepID=UPI0036A84AD0